MIEAQATGNGKPKVPIVIHDSGVYLAEEWEEIENADEDAL